MTLSIFEKKVNSVSHITHDEIFLPENLRNVYVDITQHGKILVSGNTIQKNGQDYEYKYVVYLLNEHLDIEDTFEIFIKNYELKDFVFDYKPLEIYESNTRDPNTFQMKFFEILRFDLINL